MTAANPGSLDSLTTRVASVVLHLFRVALDLNLMRRPTDGPNRIRLDDAIEGIDKIIRECQLLAVGQLPGEGGGADRRSGPHQVA